MKNIEASEIRIGNLIQDFGDGISKVLGISASESTAEIITDANGLWLPIENYSPIKLTEKWLLDFGFKKDGPTYWYGFISKNVVGYNFWINVNTGDVRFSQTNDCYSAPRMMKKYPHIHEIQNLIFAMNGYELTLTKQNHNSEG